MRIVTVLTIIAPAVALALAASVATASGATLQSAAATDSGAFGEVIVRDHRPLARPLAPAVRFTVTTRATAMSSAGVRPLSAKITGGTLILRCRGASISHPKYMTIRPARMGNTVIRWPTGTLPGERCELRVHAIAEPIGGRPRELVTIQLMTRAVTAGGARWGVSV